MYGKSMWFDLTAAKEELGWAAQYSHRRRCSASPTTGTSPTATTPADLGASHHRSPAKQGVLRVAKHLLR